MGDVVDRVLAWSVEWSKLSHEEIRERVLAQFCDRCGATEGQPCKNKNGTPLKDPNYLHAVRMHYAVMKFNRERKTETVGGQE